MDSFEQLGPGTYVKEVVCSVDSLQGNKNFGFYVEKLLITSSLNMGLYLNRKQSKYEKHSNSS